MIKKAHLLTTVLSGCMLFFFTTVIAQPDGWQDKVNWSFSVEKVNDSEAYIVATAKLKNGWHVFSVNHDPAKADLTGYPTSFKFQQSKNYKLIGKLVDGRKPITHNDDLGTSLYFEKTGIFKQKIAVLTNESFDINFEYSFQICDELGCLFPPDQEGKVSISGFIGKKDETSDSSNLIISGDFATDEKGQNYVQINNEWIAVPEGNSPKFYRQYLLLGGK